MELMEIEILKLKAQLQEKDNELADLKAKITPNVDPVCFFAETVAIKLKLRVLTRNPFLSL